MKRLSRWIGTLSLVMGWLLPPPASSAQQLQLTANLPFEFYIADTKLPAGIYSVTTLDIARSVVRLSDGKGHTRVAMTIPGAGRRDRENATLIFNRYEDMYFLAEVRWLGSSAQLLHKSPLEIQVAKSLAAKKVAAAAQNQ